MRSAHQFHRPTAGALKSPNKISEATLATATCKGCGEPFTDEDDDEQIDLNGEDWHESCFEVSGGPAYCCGIMYDNGEMNCRSCGDPL